MDILALGVFFVFLRRIHKNIPLYQCQACCLLSTSAAGDLMNAVFNTIYPIIEPIFTKNINLHILTVNLIKYKHKNLNQFK